MAGYYAGFAIFEDIVGIREWDVTYDMLFANGAAAETFATLTTPVGMGAANYNAIVVGPSAIAKGIADKMHYTSMEKDHGARLEIGSAIINGYNRVDITTEALAKEASGGIFQKASSSGDVLAALAMENTSSLVLMTE